MMMMIEGDRNEKDMHPVCKDSQEANGITHFLLYNVCIIMQMMIIFTSFFMLSSSTLSKGTKCGHDHSKYGMQLNIKD